MTTWYKNYFLYQVVISVTFLCAVSLTARLIERDLGYSLTHANDISIESQARQIKFRRMRA
jgi:hypothetical protein